MLSAVTSLKAKVGELQLELAKLNAVRAPQQEMSSGSPPLPGSRLLSSVVNSSSCNGASSKPITASTPPPDRKFNVVLFGIPECPEGMPRHARLQSDTKHVLSALPTTEPKIDSSSIRDLQRLGKFQPSRSRPRPLLVKFIRSSDVSSILSARPSPGSNVSIKPDLSKSDRLRHSILMKERWKLISSGSSRADIKVRGSSLFLHNTLHGSLDSCNNYVISDASGPLSPPPSPLHPSQS